MENVTICKVMQASYEAAVKLLEAAIIDLREAETAAAGGSATLARGTALGAEADLGRAVDLLKAVGALQQLGRA